MKITTPQVIQNGEKDLLDAVQKNLDLETVKKILKDRMAETSFLSKGGQIVVHDNQIAFRLDFDLTLSGSLYFDRQGNYIIPDSSGPGTSFDVKKTGEDMPWDSSDDLPDSRLLHEEDLEEDFPANLEEEDQEEEDLEEEDLDDEDLDDEDLEDEDLEEEDLDMHLDEKNPVEDDLDDEEIEEEHPGLDDDDADNMLDDDINDILKESREFWEHKKDI
jgi:hypothetical protein